MCDKCLLVLTIDPRPALVRHFVDDAPQNFHCLIELVQLRLHHGVDLVQVDAGLVLLLMVLARALIIRDARAVAQALRTARLKYDVILFNGASRV